MGGRAIGVDPKIEGFEGFIRLLDHHVVDFEEPDFPIRRGMLQVMDLSDAWVGPQVLGRIPSSQVVLVKFVVIGHVRKSIEEIALEPRKEMIGSAPSAGFGRCRRAVIGFAPRRTSVLMGC